MKTRPSISDLVVFRKRREPSLGVLVGLSAAEATIYSEEGRRIAVDPSRVVMGLEMGFDAADNPADLKLKLRALRKELEAARETVDVRTLWECVVGVRDTVSFDELADLYFGSDPRDPREELTLFWAVDKENPYFKRGDGVYEVRELAEVEEIVRRKEAERRRAEEKKAAVAWGRAVVRGEAVEPDERVKNYLELVRNFVVHLDEYEKAPQARSFMSEVGIRNVEEAIEFLIKAGLWSEDDDPLLERFNITRSFSEEVEREVEELLATEPSTAGLLDLSSLWTFSIDDETTEDVDDALSITATDDGYMVAVHIADVAGLVGRGSRLDEEALGRGETVYLPEGHVHMFPPKLIREALSLFAGRPKRAVSLLVYFDREFNMTSSTFAETKIVVDANLAYSGAEQVLRGRVEGEALFEIAARLRAHRIEAGGCVIDLPQLKVRVEGGEIKVRRDYMNSPVHVVVSECMILANRLAGEYLRDKGVPAIYRYITDPVPDEVRELETEDPLYPLRAVRYLRPSRLGTFPMPHQFLGVECYVQITSPIRRYLDLVMQRQLVAAIRGTDPPYGRDELERIMYQVEGEVRRKKTVERARTRYWLYKYLRGRTGESVVGYVSQVTERAVSVYVPDYLLTVDVPSMNPGEWKEGDRVELRIAAVDPLKGRLTLEQAEVGG